MFDLFNEILQTLSHNKLRTALTGLAVAWGIFMLIVLLGVARGVTNSFESNMMGPGSKSIQIWGGNTSKPYGGYREGRRIRMSDSDPEDIARSNTRRISDVSSVIYGEAQLTRSPKASMTIEYTGMYPSSFAQERYSMVSGRYINDKDMADQAHVIVLAEDNVPVLFPDGDDPLGQYVSVKGISFKVVGVYHANWGRDNIIPYTTARTMAASKDEVGSIKVSLGDVTTEADGEEAEQSVRRTLARNHTFDPDDTGALWVNNRFTQGLQAQNGMNILNMSVWVLGLLTLLSGIVGISNIMFVSVRERAHEIGVRRAIGARPGSILVQVITESVAITTLFGYIGIVMGTALTQVIGMATAESGVLENPTVNLSLAFEVTMVLIVAGALAGLFPALKAIKVKPVEALRDE